jgi:hypothetical protein
LNSFQYRIIQIIEANDVLNIAYHILNMKKILEILKEKWAEYLFEIIVIVIGILGAFTLNNWNQLRLEKIEENNILFNLKSEFEGNLEEIKVTNAVRVSMLNSTNIILKSIDNQKYSNYRLIDSLMRICFINPSFDPQQGSLNSLIFSGKLEIISDNDLRILLISWPGLVADLQEEESLLRTQAYSINTSYFEELAAMRNIMDFSVRDIGVPNKKLQEIKNSLPKLLASHKNSDYKKLFQVKSFENRLSNRFRTVKRALIEGQLIQKHIEKVLEFLELELRHK